MRRADSPLTSTQTGENLRKASVFSKEIEVVPFAPPITNLGSAVLHELPGMFAECSPFAGGYRVHDVGNHDDLEVGDVLLSIDGMNTLKMTPPALLKRLETSANIGPVTSVVRIFRISRLFRLLRFAKGLNKLFNAFLMSLPNLGNEGCVLSLLFLYAALGTNIFVKLRFYGPHDDREISRSFS